MRALHSVFLGLVLLGSSIAAWSAPESEGLLNKLLAPGPLIDAHKDLERSKCLSCHEAGKGVPQSKCLECHKEIRQAIDSKRGFHGLTQKNCIQCHSDHKGRDFNSTEIDEKKFDHGLTGFKLEGKHSELKCSECHVEKQKKKASASAHIRFFGNANTCVSCHSKDDPHFFKGDWLKRDCVACHGTSSWHKEIKFNHQKDAHYKLEGRHAALSCKECHAPKGPASARYEWKGLEKNACMSCHSDFHKGGLSPKFSGGKCDTCHNQEKWKFTEAKPFAHSVTKFNLKGRHAEIRCLDCHIQPKGVSKTAKFQVWKGPKSDCLSCHSDFHRFGSHRSSALQRPNDCQSCHSETSWKSIHGFNHSQNTRFPITGKHMALACNECHIGKDWKKTLKARPQSVGNYHWAKLETQTCESCHRSPHRETFSKELLQKKCSECHVTQGWNVRRSGKGEFDHDRETRFKLTGKHSALDCNSCHLVNQKQVFRFPGVEKEFCSTCHKNVHLNQFDDKFSKAKCSACHGTQSFTERLDFNHNETRYKIVGAHEKLKCEACHTQTSKVLEVKPPKPASKFLFPELNQESCSPCHKSVHKDQFSPEFRGKACLECHTESSFKERKVFNHDSSRFKIHGKHLKVSCAKCHVPSAVLLESNPPKRGAKFHFPNLNKDDCQTCHKDPHKGGFGNACSECHDDRGWNVTRDFHKNFTLHGVHFTLQCAECHKGDRRLSGMSQNCFFCHQKDDVHQGTLPNCGQCHGQHFWENSEYKHSLSRFPLRGAHRTIECNDCHRQGVYRGLPNRCMDCHLSAALAVTAPTHTLPAFQDCARCHNQFTFAR